jgi:DNA-binding Xre family transcriptional regulator
LFKRLTIGQPNYALMLGRLAKDQWVQLPRETLTALCDALEVEPGALFAFTPVKEAEGGMTRAGG